MKRSLNDFPAAEFDVLVIGGGILGACVARDAALRGLAVALVERGDWGEGASANSLKTVHGGLRYLQHLDLRRMRQSIRERSTWLRIAPHLVEPLPFLVPTRNKGFQHRSVLRLALAVNDLVSADRNGGLLADRRLPAGRAVSRSEVRALAPDAAQPDLTGGVLFHDAQMYSSERLVLEVVRSAHEAGGAVANYLECDSPLNVGGRLAGVVARDRLSGAAVEIRARHIVNAAGSWVPSVAARLTGSAATVPLAYSVAINFVLREPAPRVAFTLTGGARDPDAMVASGGRQLFVVPWRGQTLVGTGHYPYRGDPAEFRVSEELIESFLAEVNSAWPSRIFEREEIALVHAGLLPAAQGSGGPAVRLLKRHRVVDHAAEGVPELLSAASVKYTTARLVAEEVVSRVFRKRGQRPPPSTTAITPLPGGDIPSLDALRKDVARRFGARADPDVLEHLVRSYGTRYEQVLTAAANGDAARRVIPGEPVIEAQFEHGARHEMVERPEDLVHRRTELGARGMASAAVLTRAAGAIERQRGHPGVPNSGVQREVFS
jgi:glycerol-3-phosphate dehydrogenase